MSGRTLTASLVCVAALSGCDSLEPRGLDAVDPRPQPRRTLAEQLTDLERTPSHARITDARIAACQAWHEAELAGLDALPAPDQIADCASVETCGVSARLGPPVGVEPRPLAVPRHNLHVYLELDPALFPWQHGGTATAEVIVRDSETGASVLRTPADASAPLDTHVLLPGDRQWEIAVELSDTACHGGVAGQTVVATDLALADGDAEVRAAVSASDAAHVTVDLHVADDVADRAWLERSVWSVSMRRADVVDEQNGRREVHVGQTGMFEIDVFPGVYDVSVERIDEVAGQRLECRPRGQFESASLGVWRVADDVVVTDGTHLELELAPIAVDVELVPDAHLDAGFDAFDVSFLPRAGEPGARRSLVELEVDRAHRILLWPGAYRVQWGLSGANADVWQRELELELDASQRLELGVGAHELTVHTNLDAPGRAGWLSPVTLTLRNERGDRVVESAPDRPVLVSSDTWSVALEWRFDRGYMARVADVATGIVVDGDTEITLEPLPLDGRVRLEWIEPKPEPAVEDDTDVSERVSGDDDDAPFRQAPPAEDARVWLVDPVDERAIFLAIDRNQWRESTLATAHLFAGVYDAFSTDDPAHRWPLAACLPIDGGEPALVPWQPRLRRVTLELDGLDIRKPLELEFRLLSAAVMPEHQWVKPRTQRIHTFVEPPALYLAPGLYEIAGHQDWGGGQLEPFILEVR